MMFMVRPRLFSTACVAAGFALAVACSSTPDLPTSPTGAAPGEASAIGDLSLKASAPVPVAPAHAAEYDRGDGITLQFEAGRPLYIDAELGQQIQIFNSNGQLLYENTVSGTGVISHALPNVPAGQYEWRVRAFYGDGAGPWSEVRTFSVRGGPRTPDPPPGVRLPLPDRFHVVVAVANQYPHYLFNSCQEHGGTWDFMDTLVDTLRLEDTRWGYAWKRGRVGDPLFEVVAYNWSAEPDEGTRNIYTVDVIGGHCGSNPTPSWLNTQPSGGPGQSVWTGRGRF
jgi:hypothetical protein